jgi:hypothetical protein
MIKRYNMEICCYYMGPHIEEKEDLLGDWVSYSDLPKLIPVSERHPTNDDADENGHVLCLHEDGIISTSTIDGFRYMTLDKYLGSKVIKWSRMPDIENE